MIIKCINYTLITFLLIGNIYGGTFAENVPYGERFLIPTNKKEAVILVLLLSSFWFLNYTLTQSVKKFREDTTNKFRENIGGNVPNSSYVVYNNPDIFSGGISEASTEVSFYTYDGNFIQSFFVSIFSNANPIFEDLLDPIAPKPQPTTYEIKFLPIKKFLGINIEYKDFIMFYDKNGNEIARYHYNKQKKRIIVKKGEKYLFPLAKDLQDFPLDLSKVEEKK